MARRNRVQSKTPHPYDTPKEMSPVGRFYCGTCNDEVLHRLEVFEPGVDQIMAHHQVHSHRVCLGCGASKCSALKCEHGAATAQGGSSVMGNDELDFDEQPTTEFVRPDEPLERVHDATGVSVCIDCGSATTARAWRRRRGHHGLWHAPVCLRHGGVLERDHFDGADAEWSGPSMDTRAERPRARRP